MHTSMIRPFSALLALLPLAVATPAFAHDTGKVDTPLGSSHNWVQQQPTRMLNTDMAQVLPDDLAYVNAGGGVGGFVLGYSRGVGNGSEFGFGLNALVTTPNAGNAFNGDLTASIKHQLSRGENMAVAVTAGAVVHGLGGGPSVGIGAGLPLTFDAGAGHLTAEPRVTLPNLANGSNGASGEVALGYIAPLGARWSLMGDVTPTFAFAGGGFTLPVGIGARFSPTATSHVDFTFGQVDTTPAFGARVGLVNVLGHVGF
jgi:hypothetical protein